MLLKSEFSLKAAEVLEGDAGVLGRNLETMVEGYLASLMLQIFESIGKATDAAGTHIDAAGSPFTINLLIELLERMEMECDDDGTAHLRGPR
jgi:hypothetical protein